MSKSAYLSTRLTDYRVTLTFKSNSYPKIHWRTLLDLEPMEKVSINTETFNDTVIVLLRLSVLEDFDPHQIEWNHILNNEDVSVYVEDLDSFSSWKS